MKKVGALSNLHNIGHMWLKSAQKSSDSLKKPLNKNHLDGESFILTFRWFSYLFCHQCFFFLASSASLSCSRRSCSAKY